MCVQYTMKIICIKGNNNNNIIITSMFLKKHKSTKLFLLKFGWLVNYVLSSISLNMGVTKSVRLVLVGCGGSSIPRLTVANK